MTVTGKLYGKHLIALYNKEHDWLDDTFKCMLTTSSYSPDQDADDYKNDVTNEVTGTGYTAAGQALTNKTITYTGATNKLALDCDDPTWTSSTITARIAVFYNATGGGADSSRGLVCYQSSDADVSSSSGTFIVQIAAAGLVEYTVA